MEALTGIRERGVDVTVITNSLAANNRFTVHGGYAPVRKPLLKNDIRIYEVRPDADVAGAEIVTASGAKARLHTKAFIVDHREIFIGSFNFDPRSANINTQLGVIIRSPALAETFLRQIEASLPHQAYAVFLDQKGKLRRRGIDRDGTEVLYTKEPETSLGQRCMAGPMRLMPVRGQLQGHGRQDCPLCASCRIGYDGSSCLA